MNPIRSDDEIRGDLATWNAKLAMKDRGAAVYRLANDVSALQKRALDAEERAQLAEAERDELRSEAERLAAELEPVAHLSGKAAATHIRGWLCAALAAEPSGDES